MSIKVGIDIQASKGQITGLGVYTKHLVETLLKTKQSEFEIILLSREQQNDLNTLRRLYWENIDLVRQSKRHQLEILHVPAFSPPIKKPCKVVLTVHDIIGSVFPNQLGLPSRFYWGKWLPMVAKQADAWIADSENTRLDMVKHLQIPEKKIHVIYPSGHERFSSQIDLQKQRQVKARLGITEKYFMTVGTIEPRKNVLRVVQAFTHFLKQTRDSLVRYQLVLVGSKEFAHGKFYDLLLEFGMDLSSIISTGYVKEEDLNILYAGAQAFLFPSLYEGFGIPVLEAMASGTPVLTSRSSSLPEVGGDAVYYVDPNNSKEIISGMVELATDTGLRKELIQKGFSQIKKFSWHETARKTLQVYKQLV